MVELDVKWLIFSQFEIYYSTVFQYTNTPVNKINIEE